MSESTSSSPVEVIEQAWRQHVDADDDALLRRLIARHREKHWRYHVAAHVASVIRRVDQLTQDEPVADCGSVIAAAIYHDAIYEPASPSNERASARLARRDLTELGWANDRAERVAAMIEGTAEHRDPPDTGSAVLFDADLSILGSSSATYAQYVRDVRAEYRHMDDDAWSAGRCALVGSFLDRATIYATDAGRGRWEAAARANLRAELTELEA